MFWLKDSNSNLKYSDPYAWAWTSSYFLINGFECFLRRFRSLDLFFIFPDDEFKSFLWRFESLLLFSGFCFRNILGDSNPFVKDSNPLAFFFSKSSLLLLRDSDPLYWRFESFSSSTLFGIKIWILSIWDSNPLFWADL